MFIWGETLLVNVQWIDDKKSQDLSGKWQALDLLCANINFLVGVGILNCPFTENKQDNPPPHFTGETGNKP